MTGVTVYKGRRLRRQKKDLQDLLTLITKDKSITMPATQVLVDLLSDIANASAQSGDNEYLLAKRLHRILYASRGEGRTIKQDFLLLANHYHAGLLSWLKRTYTDLTHNEIVLCAMITLGLDPSCISKILRYDHEHTFYNKRADIRKKMHLEHTVSLEGFLADTTASLRKQHEDYLQRLRDRY